MKLNQIFQLNEQHIPMIMYHGTDQQRVKEIKTKGLQINSSLNATEGGVWAHQVYGLNPIYVFTEDSKRWRQHFSVIFEVNVAGLQIAADLPSLIDHGAYISDGNEYLYWEEGDQPPGNLPEEEELTEYLTNEHLISEAIYVTQSAAIMQNIPPSRIRQL